MSPLNPIYFEPCAGAPVASNSKYVELLPSRHPATCARQPPSGGCGTAARVGRWAPGRAVGVPAMLQRCMPACIAVTVDAACSAYLYIHLDFPWCVFEVVKFEARSKGARARVERAPVEEEGGAVRRGAADDADAGVGRRVEAGQLQCR